jgi:hypothetical protein
MVFSQLLARAVDCIREKADLDPNGTESAGHPGRKIATVRTTPLMSLPCKPIGLFRPTKYHAQLGEPARDKSRRDSTRRCNAMAGAVTSGA